MKSNLKTKSKKVEEKKLFGYCLHSPEQIAILFVYRNKQHLHIYIYISYMNSVIQLLWTKHVTNKRNTAKENSGIFPYKKNSCKRLKHVILIYVIRKYAASPHLLASCTDCTFRSVRCSLNNSTEFTVSIRVGSHN